MKFIDEWQAGCWCGAAIKICDQHIVEGEEEDFRYPEQWMFLIWRPASKAMPFNRPDAWGVSIGHPRDEMAECVPQDATIYILADQECVWSSWLTIPLVCDRFEPWLVVQIEARICEQKNLESSRYVNWYGNSHNDFQRFLNKINR